MHGVELECPLKEYPLGHALLNHGHKEQMKSPSPHCLLNSNCTPFSLPYVIKNHTPSLAPAEDSLNSDHHIDEISREAFDFFFPFSALYILVYGLLDDFAGEQSPPKQFTSHCAAVHRLDLRRVFVHGIKNCLLN